MPRGTLSIIANEQLYDAWATWGLRISDGGISTLMSAPTARDAVSNESRLETGKRYDNSTPVRYEEREITLEMHIIAPDFGTFLSRYRDFIRTINTPDGILLTYVIYGEPLRFNLRYKSCTQFGVWCGTLAKFAVRFIEPKPNLGEISNE